MINMKQILLIAVILLAGCATAQNNKPVANADSFKLRGAEGAVHFDVLANDIDTDGDALKVTALIYNGKSYSIIKGTRKFGAAEIFMGADGRGWIKAPDPITLEYKISDGRRGTDVGIFNVSILKLPSHIIGINEVTLYTRHEIVLVYDLGKVFNSGFAQSTQVGRLEVTGLGVVTLTPLINTTGTLNFVHEGIKIKIIVL